MTTHLHWCTMADCYAPEPCESARCAVTDDPRFEPRGPDRLCPKHARAAWVRVCEIVGAIVIAACVEDVIHAATEDDVSATTFWELHAAMLGWTRERWDAEKRAALSTGEGASRRCGRGSAVGDILVVSRRRTGTHAPEGAVVVYVGRAVTPRYVGAAHVAGSPLGNPFRIARGYDIERDPDDVLGAYRRWLDEALTRGASSQTAEIDRLLRLARTVPVLALECWCAPARCHADVIRDVLLARLGA